MSDIMAAIYEDKEEFVQLCYFLSQVKPELKVKVPTVTSAEPYTEEAEKLVKQAKSLGWKRGKRCF